MATYGRDGREDGPDCLALGCLRYTELSGLQVITPSSGNAQDDD